MADFRGIEGTSAALARLLQSSYASDDFGNDLQFEVYTSQNFDQPMAAGISVFLYRIVVDGTRRMPAGPPNPDGSRMHPRLPVTLHYLLTFWAREASLQHRIAAWAMRVVEDTPVLPFGLLDAAMPGAFRPDEGLEVIPAEIPNEDLFRIWEVLGQSTYQLSVPYLVRNVRIVSRRPISDGPPMQERVADMAVLEQEEAAPA